ncbi:ferric reduction oxidase 2-like isoform X2 [Neltuma alba]|uniref:ferric reduction oxidase 2-like isoform X2 n=1 Tax=Neltuma alba TaxID=207710 RepID=UPI0010A2C2CD|nr:ferric reduction oxidase 2-like isoform X2 [Prosopis alba]
MAPEMVRRSSSLEKFRRLQSAIRLLAFVVFLGSIFIWIMKPTNTFYLKWSAAIESQTRSTYFGSLGENLLIFCFPVLFIAVLGCVHVHISKKTNSINPESIKYKNPIWKRPVLVKGPLGIVSAIELIFFLMFVALLVWSLSSYLKSGFSQINKQSAAKAGEKVWQEKLKTAALMIGLVGNICLAFLFFPVARGSSVLPLLDLTSESCIKYHIWIGHIVMTLFTLHGAFYVIYWASTHQISEMLKWDEIGVSNLAGEISLLGGLLLWVVTVPRIRRKAFEVFFYTHYLYIVFFVFFVFHVGIDNTIIVLPSFYLFLLDRFLRLLQSRRHVRLLSARLLPCDYLELNFSKSHGLSYNPTSVIFINVPSISHLQWHPFTVTSNGKLEPEKLSVVIKSEGSWSQKLYQRLSSSSIDRLDVSVEGPYGPASTNYLRYDTLVMVSGGSGITPFISIIREIIYQSTTFRCKTPKVKLICSFKNSSSLSMLDLILPLSGTSSEISNIQLKIEAFVTREKEPKPHNPNHFLRTIWFKPHPTDAPISAALGPNHWLWLGAVISSSFILYLIIIGFINRYYIYPIDHNTDKKFSHSLKSFLNMLVICLAIGVTASAAFLWNKKQNAKEAKKIQNIEGSTPTVSPASMTFNADRELESLPYQTFVQATNIHYGERPDLKRMILELKDESSVGILVAGPRKMRQEVAAICSSGLAKNMHFESISFSW